MKPMTGLFLLLSLTLIVPGWQMRSEAQTKEDLVTTTFVYAPEKIRQVVRLFTTRFYLQSEENESQADVLARAELSGAGYEEAGKLISRLDQVTPASVQGVCRKYFKNFQAVLIGDPSMLSVSALMF